MNGNQGFSIYFTLVFVVPRPKMIKSSLTASMKVMQKDLSSAMHVKEVFSQFSEPWFICGGWAIDLFIGKKTREHQDVDIGIFRKSQEELYEYFSEWKLYKINNRKKEPWNIGEKLILPIHELRAEKIHESMEILLNEGDELSWLYRRNSKISHPRPIKFVDDIPYLVPEIVLLYKSKSPTERDEADFAVCLPNLDPNARTWLINGITADDERHPWIEKLQ